VSGTVRFEGKLIEELPNGDTQEVEFGGALLGDGDIRIDTDHSEGHLGLGFLQRVASDRPFTVSVDLAKLTVEKPKVIDGPVTKLAKWLQEDHGDLFGWDELDGEEVGMWLASAAELLAFVRELDS